METKKLYEFMVYIREVLVSFISYSQINNILNESYQISYLAKIGRLRKLKSTFDYLENQVFTDTAIYIGYIEVIYQLTP